MKINDRQLDQANREIAALRQSVATLQNICAKRLELLRQIADCEIHRDLFDKHLLKLSDTLYAQLRNETDENEVQTW